MRKEIIVAIVVGILLGVAIAFGIWRANTALNNIDDLQKNPPPQEENQNKTDKTEVSNGLSLVKPENFDVLTSDTTTISGLTKPSSVVFVSTEKFDYTTMSKKNGEFSQQIELVGGLNRIIIKSYDKDGFSNTDELILVYSNQISQTNQQEEETLEDKVEQKIEQASNKLKAYMGTLTDISDVTLQLENNEGDIQLVSTKEDKTIFVDVTDDSESVNINDLAIGDFLVAMGYIDENLVLNASRILITKNPNELTRKVTKGEIVETNSNSISIRDENDNINEIIISRYTDIFLIDNEELVESERSDLNKGQIILISTNTNDDKTTSRNIVIFKKPTPTSGDSKE
jgi:hypothetical protein